MSGEQVILESTHLHFCRTSGHLLHPYFTTSTRFAISKIKRLYCSAVKRTDKSMSKVFQISRIDDNIRVNRIEKTNK
ncbi:unnamed protein product [Onchocerca flexuosa]|uniref:Ovule protein n=1 Tax=Onchocerca flexuosa TaxID=387005 RepID=A0A183H0K3_9BILA|nr:unnamed protein product [Onchocerca flexuosa]